MKIEGTSGNDSSVGQVPDPRVDFAAWAEFRERQVFWDFDSRWRANPQDPELLDHFEDQMQRCHEEITDTAGELGIPVAPAGPDDEEIMRRSLALDLACRTTPIPADAALEDILRLVTDRADQILAGSVPVDAVEAIARAEESARDELAALVERHSRGEQSHVDFAARLRVSRFGLTAPQDATRMRTPAARLGRRSKPRRREHGRRARSGRSRGDPPGQSDDDPESSDLALDRRTAEALALGSSYIERGWRILPLAPGSKAPHNDLLPLNAAGKPTWRPLRDESPATIDDLRRWLEHDPDLDLGIITGAASGLIVCDIEHDGLALVPPALLHQVTAKATSPRGGVHLYFATTDAQPTQRRDVVWGDLQGDGAYVAAPSGSDERRWLTAPDQVPLASYTDVMHLIDENTQRGKAQAPSEEISPLEGMPSDLLEWDTDPSFVAKFCQLVGIEVPVGAKFACLLPGHGSDSTPSAYLWAEPTTGRVLYRCWQRKQTHALSQVYAAIVSGRPAEGFKGPTLAVWKLRLLIAARLLETPQVHVPPLPGDALRCARLAYPGLVLLFQTRALSRMGTATTITPRFFGPWCRISDDQAKEARHYFRTHGLIHRPGDKAGLADLYLPGPDPEPRNPSGGGTGAS